jgi:plasmid stabilization system protein ParE
MKLRLTDDAINDLNQIKTYYARFEGSAETNVINDLNMAFDFILTNPQAGLNINEFGTQRVISQKYSYVIVYDVIDSFIDVLGIYRHQNRDYS